MPLTTGSSGYCSHIADENLHATPGEPVADNASTTCIITLLFICLRVGGLLTPEQRHFSRPENSLIMSKY